MAALNSAVGSYSTLSLNIGDFTRYAKRPRDQFAQVLVIPVCFTATALMGVAIASGGYKVHGLAKIQFDPTRLMNNWSTDSGLERAGLFFFGFAMALSNLGSNSASPLCAPPSSQARRRLTFSNSLARSLGQHDQRRQRLLLPVRPSRRCSTSERAADSSPRAAFLATSTSAAARSSWASSAAGPARRGSSSQPRSRS